MKWDLDERTEDAIVDYLRRTVSANMEVYASWQALDIKYPCAIVHAATNSPASEEASWHDARKIGVKILVAVEATKRSLLEARDSNAFYRSEVINALAVSTLNAELIASAIDGIAFSGVIVDSEWTRDVNDRRLETELGLTVYAEPVEGS